MQQKNECRLNEISPPQFPQFPGENVRAHSALFARGFGRGLKILIAEDSSDPHRWAASLFEEIGAEVTLTSDGDVCVEKWKTSVAESKPYGLVFVDVELAGIDGFQVSRKIRESGAIVPIVIISASPGLAAKRTSSWAGGDAFLAKSSITDCIVPVLKLLLATHDRHV